MTEAQRQQAAKLAIEAQRAQALQRMGAAAEQDAATNRARFGLETQRAGVPQIFIPGVGMVPYAGGVATPYPYVYALPVPPPAVRTSRHPASAQAENPPALAEGSVNGSPCGVAGCTRWRASSMIGRATSAGWISSTSTALPSSVL